LPEKDVTEVDEEQARSSRPFWSGTITFGLVSIPVGLFPANRGGGRRLRMLSKDGTPLTRRYYSEKTGRNLTADDLTRGYELEDGRYIEITDEELERLAPEMSRDIDLRRFVPRDSISPRYFERGYFLSPAGGSSKAYRLLAQTMDANGRAGIATFVMRGKEYLVAILSDEGILRAETLRFHDEIRSPEDVGLPPKVNPPARAVHAFEKAIDGGARKDIPSAEFRDVNAERLMEVVEKKREEAGEVVGAGPAREDDDRPVTDLLEVLRRSLAGVSGGRRKEEKPATPKARKAPGQAGSDLSQLSRTDLKERAKKLNIKGRTEMSKAELIRAIRAA
jgi:DNA end-binding protein Ku